MAFLTLSRGQLSITGRQALDPRPVERPTQPDSAADAASRHKEKEMSFKVPTDFPTRRPPSLAPVRWDGVSR